MKPYNVQLIRDYISENANTFCQKKLEILDKINLKGLLKTKDLLFYRVNGSPGACKLITSLINVFISTNVEMLFDNWLKQLAIYINQQVYDGWRSIVEGIDLEFDRDNVRYIVSIQSNPNNVTRSQIKKVKEKFILAKKILLTHRKQMVIEAVNGCCYGRDSKPDKGEYYQYFGQCFWELISGNENTYRDMINQLEQFTEQQDENFNFILEGKITNFIVEFAKDFCNPNGTIDWDKLLQFNSGK